MPTSVICPECDARLTLRTAPVAGARLKCPKCSTPFAYTDPSDAETSAASKKSPISASKKSAITADTPARRQRDPDEDEESESPRNRSAARSDESDEEEDEERRPRKKKKKAKAGNKTGLMIGFAVGVGGLVVLGIVAVVVVLYVNREKPVVAQQQAKGNPPPQVNDAAVPAQPGQNEVAKANNPVPVAPPVPQPLVKVNPADLYGDQGGEQVAPADAAIPSSLMRARKDDTFFKLSNPREGEVKGPDAKGKGNNTVRQALLIDYVVARRGKLDGGILVIHTDDGGRAEVAMNFVAGRDQGTIELVGVTRFAGGKGTQVNSKTQFPKNAEFYVTRGDDRFRPSTKFMVSNSVVMGEMKVTSRARDWTPEEIASYSKGPPAYLSPNNHPTTVGEDVPPLNAGQKRFVEPEGRLIGLDFIANQYKDKKRIWRLAPIFSHDQPVPPAHTREVARPGYAVAGADVNVDKDNFIFGIRLLFRRLKSDNTLDAADAYAGEWIGIAPTAAPAVLVNDGRRIIGIRFQTGVAALVDRFALVVAK